MKIPSWLMSIGGITAKCDSCGYKEKVNIDNLTEEDINNLLGKDCPKCGHNMLNNNDIAQLKKMKNMFSFKEKESMYTIKYSTKKH